MVPVKIWKTRHKISVDVRMFFFQCGADVTMSEFGSQQPNDGSAVAVIRRGWAGRCPALTFNNTGRRRRQLFTCPPPAAVVVVGSSRICVLSSGLSWTRCPYAASRTAAAARKIWNGSLVGDVQRSGFRDARCSRVVAVARRPADSCRRLVPR